MKMTLKNNMKHVLQYKESYVNSKISNVAIISSKLWKHFIKLDKAWFQHDAAYVDFKDLAKRTASDNVLRDKAFNIATNPKCDGHQRGLASMVYKFFDKKTAASGINMNANNEKLAEDLHKPIIKKN